MHVLEMLPVERWAGPFGPDLQRRAVDALEAGRVLFFPRLAFDLDEAERALLAAATADGRSKNVSFDPATGACKGTAVPEEQQPRLAAVMRRFGDQASTLLGNLVPRYAPGLERARTSFRPAEIAGRDMPWRKDDRRLHVDAFPSRPTRGRRILRVFCNADPSGAARQWHVGEPFEAHARRFLPGLRGPLPGSAALIGLVGLTRGRRSRYDHFMLGLHDAAKRDDAYQATAPREMVDFPAGSTWVVYTDQVPHAALAGRDAFEQTFHLDPAVMADPARAPLRILERLTERALA
jgi:hypothetical protein